MKIRKISKEYHSDPIPVYDVVMASPNNNFLCMGNTGYMVAHNCGFLDEMNFSKDADASEGLAASGLMALYSAVKSRMKSRFMKAGGDLPGILFMVSSKRSEYDFLEEYVRQQKDDPHTYIVDEPVWNIKPASTYTGKKFRVAVGNRYLNSRILTPNEEDRAVMSQGYDRIIRVPEEYRSEFTVDIDRALMDIANIANSAKSRFIAFDRLERNYSKRLNPFRSEILQIGLDDSREIQNFLNLTMIDEYTRRLPGFMHLDTSLKGDRTGISYVCVAGTKNVQKYIRTESGATTKNEIDAVVRQIFTVGIEAPSNSEISFEKTRKFIHYLRERGFNLQGITVDGFQSADTIQLLSRAGFNIKLSSLDRKPDGYLALRAAINEERVDLLDLKSSKLEKELIELERDAVSGKIDHPPAGCFVADTLIQTDNGDKRIVDLVEGKDQVKAYDEKRRTFVFTPFCSLRRTKFVSKLLKVSFSDYKEKSVLCTPEHPFYALDTRTSLFSYVMAKDINPVRHRILTGTGGTVEVHIEEVSLKEAIPVYDIEVPGFSNFCLSVGFVVHNSKDLADSLCGAVWQAMISESATFALNAEDDAFATADLMAMDETPLYGMFEQEMNRMVQTDEMRKESELDADDIIF